MPQPSDRAARRADRSGMGPVRSDAPPARFPGATSAFGLLGEVLLVGVLVTLVSLPLLTLPAALAAGVRHLGRFLRAEGSGLGTFWGDLRRALPGGLVVGAASVGAAAVLMLDLVLAATGSLPGGGAIAVVGWLGLAIVATALATAAGRWSPETGWPAAVRGVPAAWRSDPAGAAYLLSAAGFAGVVTWQLVPLIVPALGCVTLAIFAVPERPSRRQETQ
ncbi:hypothetical protein ABIQ69_12910 [Agromyces sp. G08B096]|uniref:DUF624 domain-containing protein n=1 Tax=Agromyces sp. G08B096 TaxID=3156399 RepID=A0AAU7W4Z5_9MICO